MLANHKKFSISVVGNKFVLVCQQNALTRIALFEAMTLDCADAALTLTLLSPPYAGTAYGASCYLVD